MLPDPAITIRPARFPDDEAAVLEIWTEYIRSPSVSLDYQGYQNEFANLPGKYAAPHGGLYLAEQSGTVVGCIGYRQISMELCEMKRLYVRPIARSTGIGRRLALQAIAGARDAGYGEMRLDVLAEFTAAQELYASLGFIDAEPITFNPLPGTRFLGLRLR